MKWMKVLFVFLLVFTLLFVVGKRNVWATGYTNAELEAGGATCIDPSCGGGTNYTGNQNYSGYYVGNDGLNYPIGDPVVPNDGDGPAGPGCTPGTYGNCSSYGACSPACGPGSQSRTCYDLCNSVPQVQSQACIVNDPNIWLPATTPCSVKCGTGTWDLTNQCGTVQAFACNIQVCGPWIKLKDTSFISSNNLFNMIALTPDAYDSDDTTEQYLIVGKDGVAVAPSIDIEVSNLSSTAKTGNPEYTATYTPIYSFTPSIYLSYVKARKEYKVITSLGEITESGIYVYNGNVAISSNVTPFNQAYKVVLIVVGTVTINSAPDNTFTPVGTVAIVATTINFSSSMTEATGIFIGNTISTGTNAAQGLKIIGNLIAQTSLTNNRSWPTTARPSVFIKFDQSKYINLLPYLSTASYQWRQVQ